MPITAANTTIRTMTSIVQLTGEVCSGMGPVGWVSAGLDVTTGILEDGCVDGAGVVEGYTAGEVSGGPEGAAVGFGEITGTVVVGSGDRLESTVNAVK